MFYGIHVSQIISLDNEDGNNLVISYMDRYVESGPSANLDLLITDLFTKIKANEIDLSLNENQNK